MMIFIHPRDDEMRQDTAMLVCMLTSVHFLSAMLHCVCSHDPSIDELFEFKVSRFALSKKVIPTLFHFSHIYLLDESETTEYRLLNILQAPVYKGFKTRLF